MGRIVYELVDVHVMRDGVKMDIIGAEILVAVLLCVGKDIQI